MTYEDTVNGIKKFLNSPEALQVLGGRISNYFSIISMIDNHVVDSNKLENGSIQASSDQITLVQSSIEYIKNVFIELPLSKDFCDFCLFYTTLIINWLNNCAVGEKRLLSDCMFVQRFINYHITSRDMIEILPKMLQKLRAVGLIGFPSVELAKHYLSSLDGDRKEAGDAVCMGRNDIEGDSPKS